MKQKIMSRFFITFVTTSMIAIPLLAQESNKILIKKNCAAYAKPSVESPKSAYVKKDEIFSIVEETNDYYGIQLEDDSIVYIEKSYTEIVGEEAKAEEQTEEDNQEETKEEKEAPQKDLGVQITEFAKQYVGTPYVSGGTNLNKGVDCSGFAQTVYKQFGIQLQRRSRDQFSSNGVRIQRDELKPGDLVFYYSPVSHVAIYIGDGKVVHASTSSRGVVIDPVSMNGMVPVGYKRVI